MQERIKNRLLQSIANTLSLYAYHIQDAGLAKGKAGVMLFLYAYARYSGKEYYSDFAGEMLDGLLKNARTLPLDFDNGLSGVGWCVDWLLKNGHVGGNPDKVLVPVDRDLIGRMGYEKVVPNLSMAVYWAARVLDAGAGIEKSLNAFCAYLLDGLENGQHRFTLRLANDVLHFLNGIGRRTDKETMEKIRARLRPILQEVFVRQAFCQADLHVFSQIRTKNAPDIRLEDDVERDIAFGLAAPLSVEQGIKTVWRQLVYFGKSSCPLPEDRMIQDFVDRNLQRVQTEDFVLDGGLAGVGWWMLYGEDKENCLLK